MGGCAPTTDVDPSPAEGEQQGPVRLELTPSEPIDAAPLPLRGHRVLELSVVDLHNPLGQSFTLLVGLTDGETDRRFELGAATAFPADQAGRFSFAIPDELMAAGAAVDVSIELRSASEGERLQEPFSAWILVQANSGDVR